MTQRPGPKFTFKLPESARLFPTDPKSVTIAPLTLAQDIEGNKAFEASRNIMDKVKMAIVAIDGKPADWVGGGLDAQLEACSPPTRELIGQAFLKIHTPAKEDVDSFLAGMVTEI